MPLHSALSSDTQDASSSAAVAVAMVNIQPTEVKVMTHMPLGYRSTYVGYGHVNPVLAVRAATTQEAQQVQQAQQAQASESLLVVENDKKTIVVAVIDSGMNHEVLESADSSLNIWRNSKEIPGNNIDDDDNGSVDDEYGWNFANANNNVVDDDPKSHGTHVAGIVAGLSNNTDVGMKFKGSIMVVKVLQPKVSSTEPTHYTQVVLGRYRKYADAIRYAVDNGAKVINLSIDLKKTNVPYFIKEALDYAELKQVVVIVAAGNDSDAKPTLLAQVPTVLAVGSTNAEKQMSKFSNKAGAISNYVLAHGESVKSIVGKKAYDLTQGVQSGTSMAAPAVANLVAGMLETANLTPAQVRHIIMSTSQRLPYVPSLRHSDETYLDSMPSTLTNTEKHLRLLRIKCSFADQQEQSTCLDYGLKNLKGGHFVKAHSTNAEALYNYGYNYGYSKLAFGMCHLITYAANCVLNSTARVMRKQATSKKN